VGFGGCGFWCCFFGLFWVVLAVGCYFAYELGGFLVVWFVCCSGFVLCRCSGGFLCFVVLGVCFVVVLFVGMLFVLLGERFLWG